MNVKNSDQTPQILGSNPTDTRIKPHSLGRELGSNPTLNNQKIRNKPHGLFQRSRVDVARATISNPAPSPIHQMVGWEPFPKR